MSIILIVAYYLCLFVTLIWYILSSPRLVYRYAKRVQTQYLNRKLHRTQQLLLGQIKKFNLISPFPISDRKTVKELGLKIDAVIQFAYQYSEDTAEIYHLSSQIIDLKKQEIRIFAKLNSIPAKKPARSKSE